MMLSKPWNELTEAEKAELATRNRRHHCGVNREIEQVRSETFEHAYGFAVDWLRANGFEAAGAAFERQVFEVTT